MPPENHFLGWFMQSRGRPPVDISSVSLTALTKGSTTAGTNVQAIFNVLCGPWFRALGVTQFVPTFNAHGTFHRRHHLPFRRDYHGLGNLAAHGPGCRFSPLETRVLFSQDILLINVDQFTTLTTGTGSLGAPFESNFVKPTP